MSELALKDIYDRGLYFTKYAGQICVTPIVHRKGDTIALNDYQAKELLKYLEEHFK